MFKMFLLLTPLALSLGNLDFIQYWDQNIRVDISTEAVVVPRNETMDLFRDESYCYDTFLDDICTVPEKGCVGDLYYIEKQFRGRLFCNPATKYQNNKGMNEGIIIPRFIQARIDVGPMYHYYEIEFRSSRHIPSKYTTRNIQNSFNNGNGKGNIVYTIRDFGVGESQPSSPKLIFQH
ncbi:hypothetical protein HDV04_003925 [Boothiomyces sp. JEL0838]|nr:hypothetical protein HDV04_003925 [Boothiomyces sp. JEL0838]